MPPMNEPEPGAAPQRSSVERTSDREVVVRRRFAAPARLVFAAWTTAELFQRWWVPKSAPITLLSCEMDVRVGGGYRLRFAAPGHGEAEFFGRYLEVVPDRRLSWTNEEEGGGAITTVTLEEADGVTTVVLHELHPSKEALDEALASGAYDCMDETLDQLAAVLAA